MMIYLVTANLQLFSNNCYKVVGIDESLSLLSPLKYVGLDTETTGLDPYTCKLKLCQLGCSEFQIVIDCDTIDIGNYKEFLESDRIFIGWNLKFDLKFLMHHGIVLNEIYDGFTAEKLMYLGYPSGMHSMSLKSAAYNYMNILMDKSVRGKVIWSPTLTDDIVLYSANDVRYLEDIMVKQNEDLENRDLVKAFDYENHFVIICAYFEYCGVKLDVEKWKIKMDSDKGKLDKALAALNKWVEDNLSDSAFTKVDRQGNLFTGFDISPKCIVNWNSPKQVIPLMKKLGYPTIFCNTLEVADNGEITGFKMRCEKSKLTTVKALQSIGFETIASGDSHNDLGMIQASKAGFLFKSTDKIKADYPEIPAYEEFDELLAAIRKAL